MIWPFCLFGTVMIILIGWKAEYDTRRILRDMDEAKKKRNHEK